MAEGWPTNAGKVAADMSTIGRVLPQRVWTVVSRYGKQVETQAKANASGRPGPRAITGHLRRTIHSTDGIDGGVAVARIGSNAPQARRLELGFTGTDSLGRRVSQPPYPYLGPAADSVRQAFVAALAALAGQP